jgi:uncharacterized protein YukE
MHIQRSPETGDIVISNEAYTDNFCIFNEDIEQLRKALNIAANLDEMAASEAIEKAREYSND